MYRAEATITDLAYDIVNRLAEYGLVNRSDQDQASELVSGILRDRKAPERVVERRIGLGLNYQGVGPVQPQQWQSPTTETGWEPPAPEPKNKILIIKNLREHTGTGLLEAKLAAEKADLDFWKAVELIRNDDWR